MTTTLSEYDGEELEAMRPSDSTWHPCKVYLSTFGNCLFIDYGSHEPEDMIVTEVEALERLRFRSTPLSGDECTRINRGDHVLVAHQSLSANSHYDAAVKEVVRVRHSKRNNCNCTFVIEFLERKGEYISIASNSLMTLHKKNVKLHPVVCKFLKVIKSQGESTASPFSKADHVTDTNEDSNGVLEKHFIERNDVADVPENDITTTIIRGLKDDGKAPLQRRLIDEFNLADRNVQASRHMENQKIMLQRRETSQLVMTNEDVVPSVPSISELPKNRFRLSPLGARAALASLVSTIHAPTTNDAKIPPLSISMHASIVGGKASEVLSKSVSSYSRTNIAHSITEGKLPEPGNPGRITRSAAQKASKFPEDDSSTGKYVKRSSLVSSRRCTRSSVLEQDIEASSQKSNSASDLEQRVEVDEKGSNVKDLVRPMVMKSAPRKDNDLSKVEDDANGASGVHCAPLSVDSVCVVSKSNVAYAAMEVSEPVVTRRLTRSAARSTTNSESCKVGVLMESSAVTRRCTRSSRLGRSESMVARDQGPEDSNLVPNTEQKSNPEHGSRRKDKLLILDGRKMNHASDMHGENNKVAGTDNHERANFAETANHGQKRKDARLSTLAAERRFSPRLRNLCQG